MVLSWLTSLDVTWISYQVMVMLLITVFMEFRESWLDVMEQLSYLTHAQLELDLVFHVHDERVVLDELRCLLITSELAKVGEVKPREPVHEPELEHK